MVVRSRIGSEQISVRAVFGSTIIPMELPVPARGSHQEGGGTGHGLVASQTSTTTCGQQCAPKCGKLIPLAYGISRVQQAQQSACRSTGSKICWLKQSQLLDVFTFHLHNVPIIARRHSPTGLEMGSAMSSIKGGPQTKGTTSRKPAAESSLHPARHQERPATTHRRKCECEEVRGICSVS